MQERFNNGWGGGGGPGGPRGGAGHPGGNGHPAAAGGSARGTATAGGGNGFQDYASSAKRAYDEAETYRARRTTQADEEIARGRERIFGSTRATQAFYAMTPAQHAAGRADMAAHDARMAALPNAWHPAWAQAGGTAPEMFGPARPGADYFAQHPGGQFGPGQVPLSHQMVGANSPAGMAYLNSGSTVSMSGLAPTAAELAYTQWRDATRSRMAQLNAQAAAARAMPIAGSGVVEGAAGLGLAGIGAAGTIAATALLAPALQTTQGQEYAGGLLNGPLTAIGRGGRKGGFIRQYFDNVAAPLEAGFNWATGTSGHPLGLGDKAGAIARGMAGPQLAAYDADQAVGRAERALAHRRTLDELNRAANSAINSTNHQLAGMSTLGGLEGAVAATAGQFNLLNDQMGRKQEDGRYRYLDQVSGEFRYRDANQQTAYQATPEWRKMAMQQVGLGFDAVGQARQMADANTQHWLGRAGIQENYRDSLIGQRDATESYVGGSLASLVAGKGSQLRQIESGLEAMQAGRSLNKRQALALSGAGIEGESIDKTLFDEVTKKAPLLAEKYKEMLRAQNEAVDKQIEATEDAKRKADEERRRGVDEVRDVAGEWREFVTEIKAIVTESIRDAKNELRAEANSKMNQMSRAPGGI